MIDLSYLTSEEREKILAVLKRDANLKKADELRVKKLETSVHDRTQLKYMTGEWFYETKSQRHHDRIHGSDIIQASMNKEKPVTILELSQSYSEKPSMVNSANLEVFIPPELSGLIQEPSPQPRLKRNEHNTLTAPQPQTKERQNPFNSGPLRQDPSCGTDQKLLNGAQKPKNTPEKDQHENHHADPPIIQVSDVHGAVSGRGKPIAEWAGSQSCKLTEESQSIAKVLDWFSHGSSSSDGHKGQLSLEEDRREPECLDGSGTEELEEPQIVVMPSPKIRTSHQSLHYRDEEEGHEGQLNHCDENKEEGSSLKSQLMRTSANIRDAIFKLEQRAEIMEETKPVDQSGSPPCHDSSDQVDRSSKLANLKSFWENENRGPKVLISNPKMISRKTEGSQKVHSQDNSEEGKISFTPSGKQNTRTSACEDSKDAKVSSFSPVEPLPGHISGVKNTVNSNKTYDKRPGLSKEVKGVPLSKSPLGVSLLRYKELEGTFGPPAISSSSEEYMFAKTLWEEDKHVFVNPFADTSDETFSLQSSGTAITSPSEDNERMRDSQNKERVGSTDSNDDNYHKCLRDELKVSPRDSYRTKVNLLSLKTFPIDISTFNKALEGRSETSLNTGSHGLESENSVDKKVCLSQSKAGWPELRRLSLPQRSSDLSKLCDVVATHSAKRANSQPAEPSSSGNFIVKESSPYRSSPERVSDRRSSGNSLTLKDQKLLEESHSHLARSFVPRSPQHYLGIPEWMHVPEFSNLSEMMERSRSLGGDSSDDSSSIAFQEDSEDAASSRSSTPCSDACSLSWTSPACNIEDASPARRAMKKLSPRPLSLSKSLEDITKVPALSATPISPTSTFLNPEQMKMMSTSVPSSLQEQSNGRFPPENSFHADRQKAMNSSQTNISCSSGMASMSSASGSVMSIYMGDYGNVEVRGTIRFAMNYVEKIGEFHICVVQCKDLAVAEPKRNRSDPYVKCYLMPDKTKLGKRKTSVKKKTLNPTYNEILKYKIAMETLKTQTLNLSVWHNDTFGRNSFLGEVDIDLSKWSFSNTQMKDFVLKARPAAHFKPTDHRGEVRVALRFLPGVSQSKSLPKMGEIQIWVKECRNLPAVRGVIDPFIKCAVLPDTSRKSRQKTRVVKKSANPAFNHTMVYNGFGAEDLQETCVELTVWDHDRLNNHFLGGLRLGLGTGKSYGSDVDWMDSNPDERTMWDRMMESPNEWVEDVLPLRMLMMARSMSK